MTPEYILKVLVNSCTVNISGGNGVVLPVAIIKNDEGDVRFYDYDEGAVTSNRIERITYEDMRGRIHTEWQRSRLEQVKDKRLIKAIMAFVGREMLS